MSKKNLQSDKSEPSLPPQLEVILREKPADCRNLITKGIARLDDLIGKLPEDEGEAKASDKRTLN